MESSIHLVKKLHGNIHEGLMVQLFQTPKKYSDLWEKSGQNILNFINSLEPSQRTIFSNYLSLQVGEDYYSEIRKAYSLISLLYRQVKEKNNCEIWKQFGGENNMAYFLSILGQELLNTFLEWVKMNISENDINNALSNGYINFNNLADNTPQREYIQYPRYGRTVRNTRPAMSGFAPNPRQPGMNNTNHSIKNSSNNSNYDPPRLGVRGYDELKAIFGEK